MLEVISGLVLFTASLVDPIYTPSITSSPTTQEVTHCGVYIDSKLKVESPVDSQKRCNIDLTSVFPSGVHSLKATYINYDSSNIRVESKGFSNILLVYRVNISKTTWWFMGEQIVCVSGVCVKKIPQ